MRAIDEIWGSSLEPQLPSTIVHTMPVWNRATSPRSCIFLYRGKYDSSSQFLRGVCILMPFGPARREGLDLRHRCGSSTRIWP
jgi:hypothetical protein